jgi:hypothetical protein
MARAKYHELVKTALIKEGWHITADPLRVRAGNRKVQVDLGAERIITAERGSEKIAVEVKSFIGVSTLHDFYEALGQFNFYQYAVGKVMPDRELLLAIPDDVYNDFFREDFIKGLLVRHQVKLIIYQVEQSPGLQWIR